MVNTTSREEEKKDTFEETKRSTIDQYRLIRVLGEGLTSKVYLGTKDGV